MVEEMPICADRTRNLLYLPIVFWSPHRAGEACPVSVGKDEVPGSNPGISSRKKPVISTVTGFFVVLVASAVCKLPPQLPPRRQKCRLLPTGNRISEGVANLLDACLICVRIYTQGHSGVAMSQLSGYAGYISTACDSNGCK